MTKNKKDQGKIRNKMKTWNLFTRMGGDELNALLPEGANIRGKPMTFGTSDKYVAEVFYHNANQDGFVTLSIPRIAHDALLSHQTVRDAIKKLIAARMLKIVRRGGNKPNDPNIYKIRFL